MRKHNSGFWPAALDGIRARDAHAARVATEKHIAAAHGRMELYYHQAK